MQLVENQMDSKKRNFCTVMKSNFINQHHAHFHKTGKKGPPSQPHTLTEGQVWVQNRKEDRPPSEPGTPVARPRPHTTDPRVRGMGGQPPRLRATVDRCLRARFPEVFLCLSPLCKDKEKQRRGTFVVSGSPASLEIRISKQ